jgi:hypothetical protein
VVVALGAIDCGDPATPRFDVDQTPEGIPRFLNIEPARVIFDRPGRRRRRRGPARVRPETTGTSGDDKIRSAGTTNRA